MFKMIKKFGRYLKYLVWPHEQVLDDIIKDADRAKIIKQLDQPGRLEMRDVDGNVFKEVVERSRIPTVESILGDYDCANGNIVEWDHPDDLIISFSVVRGWLVDDQEWFMRYIKRDEMSMFEKHEYQLGARPVKVDRSALKEVADTVQWSIIFDNARCFHIHWRGVSGILMINHDDVASIVREQVDVEQEDKDAEISEFCICTFMQFSVPAINRLRLSAIHRDNSIYLPLNFAV